MNTESFQVGEQAEVVFVGEPGEDRLGNDLTDVGEGQEVFQGGFGEGLETGEVAGEGSGGLGADVADAEGGEELLEGRGFGGLDRLDEIGGREVGEAV